MARSRPASVSPRLRAYPWRRVGGLAGISLVLSGVLVAYLFGWTDHFASRLLTAFWVGFCLLSVTFLGILPFIGWATAHWFGPGWGPAIKASSARRTPASAARSAAARSTTT